MIVHSTDQRPGMKHGRAEPVALPAPLDVMSLGNFEPDVWIPSAHPAARRGTISLGELARMDVIHGPRRLEPGIYDAR